MDVWDKQCQNALNMLNTLLQEEPILAIAIQQNYSYYIQIDTSQYGVGAVLSQTGKDGCKHPIGYTSRKLLTRKTGY